MENLENKRKILSRNRNNYITEKSEAIKILENLEISLDGYYQEKKLIEESSESILKYIINRILKHPSVLILLTIILSLFSFHIIVVPYFIYEILRVLLKKQIGKLELKKLNKKYQSIFISKEKILEEIKEIDDFIYLISEEINELTSYTKNRNNKLEKKSIIITAPITEKEISRNKVMVLKR